MNTNFLVTLKGITEFIPKNVTLEECGDSNTSMQALRAFKTAAVSKQQVTNQAYFFY
jgi:hypothetical protein